MLKIFIGVTIYTVFLSFYNNLIFIEIIIRLAQIIIFIFIFYHLKLNDKNSFRVFKFEYFSIFIISLTLYFCYSVSFYKICILNDFLTKPNHPFESIDKIILMIVIVPISEEVFYRGLFFNLIKRNNQKNYLIPIIITSTFFSIYHFDFSINFFDNFVFSVIVTSLYIKFKNLYYSIFFHVLTNYVISTSFIYYVLNLNVNYYVLIVIAITSILILFNILKKVKT